MENFNHPVYQFWNGKNTADEKSFTSLVASIKASDDKECPCTLSCETAHNDEP